MLVRHNAALSHHHGVGLPREPYMADSLGSAFAVLQAIMRTLDPRTS